jgi:hypothetical protein
MMLLLILLFSSRGRDNEYTCLKEQDNTIPLSREVRTMKYPGDNDVVLLWFYRSCENGMNYPYFPTHFVLPKLHPQAKVEVLSFLSIGFIVGDCIYSEDGISAKRASSAGF